MKVSVILTSYNHEKFLRKSIESVLNQTYRDFELIIVDDCSQDSSWEIIESYTDERIVAIRNPINLRTEGIYNAIKSHVQGEYIAMHHSDDVWTKNKLATQVDYLNKHSNVAAVFTRVTVIDENDNDYQDEDGFYYKLFTEKNRSRYEWLNYFFYHGNCLCHPSVMIRREIFEKEQMFDFGFAQMPDFSRWIRICLKHDIYILPEKLTKFRIQNNDKNTSGNRADTVVRSSIEWFHMLKLYLQIDEAEDFLKVFPQSIDYVDFQNFMPEYALARVCTEENMKSYTRLFGYELLYELMNDRIKAQYIENRFGFSFRDLIEMTGKEDIFHVLPDNSQQVMTLYFEMDNGEVLNETVKRTYYLNQHNIIFWDVDLKAVLKGKKVRKIRFDPAEGVLVGCKVVDVKVNNRNIELFPYNAAAEIDELTIFETLDPIYKTDTFCEELQKFTLYIEVVRINDAWQEKITFNISNEKELLQQEIGKRDRWIKQLSNEKSELEQSLREKKIIISSKDSIINHFCADKEELEKQLLESRAENSKLSIEYHQIKKKLDEIYSHRIYKWYIKIKNIKKKKELR